MFSDRDAQSPSPLFRLDIHGVAVTGALANGATVEAGGQAIGSEGYFYQPMLLTNIKPTDPILREQIFVPVITIVEPQPASNVRSITGHGALWRVERLP